MTGDDVDSSASRISRLLEERLKLKGRTLEQQVGKLGRTVPRGIARDARHVARAQVLVQNPKLARMVDEREFRRAANAVIAHLEALDPRQIALDRLLLIAAKWSAFGLIVAGGLIWYAWSQGMV